MRRVSWALGLGAILVCLAPVVVEAQDARAVARQHYASGQQLFEAGQFAAAEAQFRAAYAAVPNPVVLRAIGSAQLRQSNWSGAIQSLEQYLRENPAATDRGEVEREIAEARSHTSTTVDPNVQTDPNAVDPNATDPNAGYGEEEGPPEPSIGVWIAAGVAAAALVLGTVMGFLALSEQSNFDAQPAHDIADRGEAFALTADISFGVAGAAAITAVVLYIIEATSAGSSEEAPAAEPVALNLAPWATLQGGGLAAQLRF